MRKRVVTERAPGAETQRHSKRAVRGLHRSRGTGRGPTLGVLVRRGPARQNLRANRQARRAEATACDMPARATSGGEPELSRKLILRRKGSCTDGNSRRREA